MYALLFNVCEFKGLCVVSFDITNNFDVMLHNDILLIWSMIKMCSYFVCFRFINARRRIVQPMIDQSNRAGKCLFCSIDITSILCINPYTCIHMHPVYIFRSRNFTVRNDNRKEYCDRFLKGEGWRGSKQGVKWAGYKKSASCLFHVLLGTILCCTSSKHYNTYCWALWWNV